MARAGTGGVGRARSHRARWVAAIALVVVLGTLGTVLVLWQRSGSHQVSTEEARRRFQQQSSTSAPAAASWRPPAGVYEYRGSGTEHLSLPPKSQGQGPTMPGTVTYGSGGCWTFRIDYSSNHWQTWSYCSRGNELQELGGESFARWDFVFTKYENTATFTCDPPSVDIRVAMRAGDTWSQRCDGTSTGVKGTATSAGPYTFVGEEQLDIGGTRVAAYHFRQRRTLTGSQSGTQDADLWFARSNGLPLRNDRTVTLRTKTVVGTSVYTEHGTFVLQSLQPQR